MKLHLRRGEHRPAALPVRATGDELPSRVVGTARSTRRVADHVVTDDLEADRLVGCEVADVDGLDIVTDGVSRMMPSLPPYPTQGLCLAHAT